MDTLFDLLPEREIRSVCFTGHRQISFSPVLNTRLRKTLEELIGNGVVDFYVGGALGWDMLCARVVLSLRSGHPEIQLHVILPCPPEEQSARWSLADRKVFNEILKQAASVEVLSQHYYDGCMKKRNLRLVEEADCCVCYYNPAHYASGTGQTVRLAEKKGIRIINLA